MHGCFHVSISRKQRQWREFYRPTGKLMRIVLIGIGIISLILGVIGIFLPLLPTVPFLLLSAACFSRGSKRMHRWLVRLPHVGKVVDDYEQGKGVSRKAKMSALVMLWGGMTVSAILIGPPWWALAIMATTALVASVIIVRLPKAIEPAANPVVVDTEISRLEK